MHTYLDNSILEKRTICNLFPKIQHIANDTISQSFNIIKQNKRENNISLSEMLDAFWWCFYGFIYSNEKERLNAESHDKYFYDKEAFQNDTETIFKCEMMRTSINKHRYPIPKKPKSVSDKKKIKEYNDYCMFINRSVIFMTNKDDNINKIYSPEVYKMKVDMVRSSQERLIGNNPDFVNSIRKEQFINIGNLLDDVFIHRGYINKIKEDGAEMLTPEELDEWEDTKERIINAYKNIHIPEFVRIMINEPDFILEKVL